ncbi:hypothetical protein ACN27F_27975 [Solwaraspora sp. WMMB335]|uniref:hypothetical protein n=1 Tax=Solwaraspora sp. WMMB335 TaxID=3404118 RepID=UPI003B96601D
MNEQPAAACRRTPPGRRTVTAVLGAVLGVLLLLAGCTSSSDDETPPPPPVLPTGPALPTLQPYAGQTHPFGAHWDWSRYDQFLPYLRKLSGSATYHEMSWCGVEPVQGQRDWSALDQIAQRSQELGITLNLKIRTEMCWVTGGTPEHVRGEANKTESATPLDMAAYRQFVGDVVRRYTPYGVRQYAIENEVNAQQYWAGSPQDYIELVTVAAEAIHAADASAVVVDSGISSVAYGFGVVDRLVTAGRDDEAIAAYNAYFQRRIGTRGRKIPQVSDIDTLRTALANETNVRNLDFLAATEQLLDDGVVQLRQVHYYEHYEGVPALLDYLAAETPDGVPVEAWEVGQFWRDGDGDSTSRAEEVVKVSTMLLAGGIRQVMWLPLGYNPQNRAGSEVRYGLLEPDGTEREAGRMFETLAESARGATVSPVRRDGLIGVAFQQGEQSTLVVWSSEVTDPVRISPAPSLHAGAAGASPTKAAAEVIVTDRPVLLRATASPDSILDGVE